MWEDRLPEHRPNVFGGDRDPRMPVTDRDGPGRERLILKKVGAIISRSEHYLSNDTRTTTGRKGPGNLASDSASSITKHIDALFRTGTAIGLSDGCLLDRFRGGPADQAEVAFAVLVERHGPMVFHVCRRILGDRHDAEDAAQAVFLLLARQARSIRRSDSVASWLYGVATRVATRARLDAIRRRLRERKGAERSMAIRDVDHGERDASGSWPELYQELGRLPERFRLPILLCQLEGLTHEQAAQLLGCPVRTIQSRLSRGRERLRDRLIRRGLAPAIAALTAALTSDVASAAVSETWKRAIVTAAVRYATGDTAGILIPSTVALLAKGATRAMNLHRLMKWATAVVLIGVTVGGAGMGMLAQSAPSVPERPASADSAHNRYRVTMAGGATFEVVAILKDFKTWYRPDGTPLDESPADRSGDMYSVKTGEELQTVLVRVANIPKDATLKWVPTYDEGCYDYLGVGLGNRVTKGGKIISELRAYVVSLRSDRTTGSVQIQFAPGPWKTEVSDRARARSGGITVIKEGHKFYFGRMRAYQGGTTVAVAHNLVDVDVHTRLVAVDLQGGEHPPTYYADADAKAAHSYVNHMGREHPAHYSTGAGGEILSMFDAEFALPPNQIQEFRVQSRPFERAEIKDIALRPRAAGN
jgi:RNA polymerase sigma factor (sigma-70 family)